MIVGSGTEEYYRRRAAEYDLVYDKPERQADLALLRLQISGLLTGRRVLEVAAGTGWWTDSYAEAATAVTATDVNRETLAVARGRRSWPEGVDFRQADAFSLDHVAGDFDAVFVGFFWSHVPAGRLDDFLGGVARRVGSGGRLVFIDNLFVEGSNQPVTRRDGEGNTFQRRRLGDGTSWEVLKNFPTADQVENRLRAVCSDVIVRALPYYWVAVGERI